jgi:hypothetical protein
MLALVFYVFVPNGPKQADATAAWLSGWNYRQAYTVPQTTGAGSNYQLNVTVCNSTGTSSGPVLYADGHVLKSDFSDVRVTTNDGTTLLNIANETINSGTNATVWFKDTDNLSNGASTVYVYYGNVAAATVWNGWNTFLLYDNFQSSTLNATTWSNFTTATADTFRYFNSSGSLTLVQSSTQQDFADGPGASGYLGLKVYVGNALVSGATCVAVSTKGTSSASYKSGSWICPGYSNVGQVSIAVYSTSADGSSYQSFLNFFNTTATNLQLAAATWTVNYGIKWTSGTTTVDFYFGAGGNYYNSYVSGFTWQSPFNVTIASGVATVNSYGSVWEGLNSTNTWNQEVAARTFMQLGTAGTGVGDTVGFYNQSTDAAFVENHDSTNAIEVANGTTNVVASNLDGNWGTFDLEWNASRVDFIRNGTALTGSPLTTDVPSHALPFEFTVTGTSGPVKVQWVFIRSYVYPEPASGTWGAEKYKTFSVTVTSSPATGSGYVMVDGSAQSTPYTATWNVGDSHTIAANSPANTVTNQSQYVYASWNDSGSQSHSVSPDSATTYTVTFTIQYYLRVDGGNGPTGGGWYASGASASASNNWVWSTVSGQSRSALTDWQLDGSNQNPSRSNTGNLTSSSITMSTYHLVAFVSATQYYNTLSTAVSGSTVSQSGSQTSDNWYDSGTSSSVSATTPYLNGTTNRWLFDNWTWTRGGVAQTFSTSNPFSITMSNYVAVAGNWKLDFIVLFSSSIASVKVNVGASVYINLTYKWQSDNAALADGFTVQVNGSSRSLLGGWTNFTYSEATAKTDVFQVSQFEGGSYYVNSVTPTETWESLTVGSLQSVVYLGSGAYNYTTKITYTSSGSAISGAQVGLANSTTVLATALSNSTGWATFTISQALAASESFILFGVNDSAYNITNAAVNQIFTLNHWTLNTQDVAGNALTNTTSSVTVNGVSVWTGQAQVYVPPNTYNVTVTWLQSLTLNKTTNVAVAADTSLNLNCTAYPVSVYWAASNATITSLTYTANVITVSFAGSPSSYVFVSSYPTIPSYILNCTYDVASVFTPYGYLVLPNYGNTTLTVSYESWSPLYVVSTDQTLTSASISNGHLTISPNGTGGDIGNIKIYCGGLGDPAITAGFTTTTYGSQIMSGTYVLNGQVLTLSWASSPFTGNQGGTTVNGNSALSVSIVFTFPSLVQPGQIAQGTLTVTWTSYAEIYIWQILCNEPFNGWTLNVGSLPLALQSSQYQGNSTIPVTLTVPSDVTDGSYHVPCNATFQTPTGDATTVGTTVDITVSTGAGLAIGAGNIPAIEMGAFLGTIGLFILSMFLRKKSRSRRQPKF